MGKVVLIVGDTGTGKSTSIKPLDPTKTAIINVLGKPLPFKDSGKLYNEENKNIKAVTNWNEVVGAITGVGGKAGIENVIIDDAGFIMTSEFFARSSEKG